MKLELRMVRREIMRSIEQIQRSRANEVAKNFAISELESLSNRIKYGSDDPLPSEIENQEVELKGECEQ